MSLYNIDLNNYLLMETGLSYELTLYFPFLPSPPPSLPPFLYIPQFIQSSLVHSDSSAVTTSAAKTKLK